MQDINSRFHKSVVYTIVGIMLIPILATFIYSISSRWGATILPDGFTFDWYIKLLTDPRFLQAFGRSLFIGLSALALSVVLVLPAIFVVFYYFPKLDKLMNILILLPFAVPPVVSSVGLLQLYADSEISLIGTPWILVGTYFTIALPFMYRAISNSFEAINLHDLMDAAHLLGASTTKAFFVDHFAQFKERFNGIVVPLLLILTRRVRVRQYFGRHSLRNPTNLLVQHASNQRPLHICARDDLFPVYFLTDLVGKSFQPRSQIMSYVTAKNLTKRFGDNTVFEDIQFAIEQGEFITLLGPSGCGKSTLLRSLAGLNPVDGGEIWVNGEEITHQVPQERGIGMVFQSYALFPNMTVEGNIAFGLKMKKLASDEIQREVTKVIELVDLKGKEKHYPHQLSGGQRQRVALARALVVKPRILLLDEPLSALDAKIRKHLRQQIRDIQKEMNLTTIFVTHDQEEAMIMSDRIFLMNKGEIVQAGTPEAIYTHPANEFVAGFMGHYNLVDANKAKQLFNIDTEWKVAIRPESIYVKEHGRQYGNHISAPQMGTIKNHQLLGNVIRYQVCVEECDLTVDLLNRSSERLLANGSQLELLFNLNEIQPVRA